MDKGLMNQLGQRLKDAEKTSGVVFRHKSNGEVIGQDQLVGKDLSKYEAIELSVDKVADEMAKELFGTDKLSMKDYENFLRVVKHMNSQFGPSKYNKQKSMGVVIKEKMRSE